MNLLPPCCPGDSRPNLGYADLFYEARCPSLLLFCEDSLGNPTQICPEPPEECPPGETCSFVTCTEPVTKISLDKTYYFISTSTGSLRVRVKLRVTGCLDIDEICKERFPGLRDFIGDSDIPDMLICSFTFSLENKSLEVPFKVRMRIVSATGWTLYAQQEDEIMRWFGEKNPSLGTLEAEVDLELSFQNHLTPAFESGEPMNGANWREGCYYEMNIGAEILIGKGIEPGYPAMYGSIDLEVGRDEQACCLPNYNDVYP